MVIEPIINPKTKKPYTNIEITHIFYNTAKKMRDGVAGMSDEERRRQESEFYRICGGSQNAEEIMNFCEQFENIEDKAEAQRVFAMALLPVNTIGRK